MKKRRVYTWKAFWMRQLKLYVPIMPAIIVMWDIVEYGRIVHEYFGWAFEGYGPPQQRWYRVVTVGMLLTGLFGSLVDAMNTWHYIKNPNEIPTHDDDESN